MLYFLQNYRKNHVPYCYQNRNRICCLRRMYNCLYNHKRIFSLYSPNILQAKKKVGKDADRIYKHENQNLNIFDNQNFKRFFAARCDKLNRIADFFADERFGNRR